MTAEQRKIIRKRYYDKHKEKIAKKVKEWSEANKERVAENHRLLYLRKKEAMLERSKNWYKTHPESSKKYTSKYKTKKAIKEDDKKHSKAEDNLHYKRHRIISTDHFDNTIVTKAVKLYPSRIEELQSELCDRITTILEDECTEHQQIVTKLYLDGIQAKDIAKQLNRNPTAIHNCLYGSKQYNAKTPVIQGGVFKKLRKFAEKDATCTTLLRKIKVIKLEECDDEEESMWDATLNLA